MDSLAYESSGVSALAAEPRASVRAPADEEPVRLRLAAFFRAHGLADGQRIEALADRFLAEARCAGSAPEAPLVAAADTTNAWLASLPGIDEADPERAAALGRAAFILSGAAQRWPDAFLARDLPADLADAVRRAVPVPVPEPASTPMVSQSLAPPMIFQAIRRFVELLPAV